MSTSAIAATSPASASASELARRLPVKTLEQQDFLKLLVAQLSAQDPLNPQKDTEFIAQMAQFSALEQARTMQSDLAALRDQEQFSQAGLLLGRQVQLQEGSQVISGTVQAVRLETGTPRLSLDSRPGVTFGLDQLLSVATVPTQP